MGHPTECGLVGQEMRAPVSYSQETLRGVRGNLTIFIHQGGEIETRCKPKCWASSVRQTYVMEGIVFGRDMKGMFELSLEVSWGARALTVQWLHPQNLS